ncbi:hypothetical protein RJT34_24313 [Clitoria ternatea]|uniref:SWIM-type domain-containing protein n=1 Tax=Clitoria ternatea TaxID=43366 RepID=A0AAN9IL82_CLITE
MWTGDGGTEKYEVSCYPARVAVNLGTQECTCRMWQLTGMPCRHACAAIAEKGEHAEDHCHVGLTMAAWNATYEHHVESVPGSEFWEKTGCVPPIPPFITNTTGRPKKQRRKTEFHLVVVCCSW